MNLVLEGPDGGGKSTLALKLGKLLRMPVQQGSGPPKDAAEIEARLEGYLAKDSTIFDRHPAVSQVIYGSLRGDDAGHIAPHVKAFYQSKPLLVYCRTMDPTLHTVKPGESVEQIQLVNDKFGELVEMYDAWALAHAHLIYRIGDDVETFANLCRGAIEVARLKPSPIVEVIRAVAPPATRVTRMAPVPVTPIAQAAVAPNATELTKSLAADEAQAKAPLRMPEQTSKEPSP